MNSRNLFLLNAIVALLFGLAFLLVPGFVASLYGVAQDPDTLLLGRYFGSALIAVGLICWLARDASDRQALRAIMLGLLISHVLGAIVSLMGVLSGVVNSLGWSTVVLYLVLMGGYGYLLFARPADS